MNNSIKESSKKKSTKGFYAALGISAVMIGSACFFSYKEGNKLAKAPASDIRKPVTTDTAVDNKQDGVPKTTTTVYIASTKPSVTTTAAAIVTIPAADIIKTDPPEDKPANAEKPADKPVNTSKLENPKPPLADMSGILNPFSGGELVKNETTGSWQTHNGADIKAEVGAEVYAISSGEVVGVDNDQLWGVTVTVDHHNGYVSRYCNLGTDLSVQKGDVLAAGAVIGAVGTTADIESALEPHLHIELKHSGSYVDPVSAVDK